MKPLRSLPQPSAKGNLADKPLAQLLLYIRDRRLTGSLVFFAPLAASAAAREPQAEGDAAQALGILVFQQGSIRKAHMHAPAVLADILIELKLVSAARLATAVEICRAGNRLVGAHLVKQHDLSEEALARALTEQVLRRAEHAMALPAETPWTFHDRHDALSGYGGEDWPFVDCYLAVWRGLRWANLATVRDIVAYARDRRFLVKDAAAIDELGLSSDEKMLVNGFRSGASFDEIATARTEPELLRLFYFLLLARLIVHAPIENAGPRGNPQGSITPMPASHVAVRPSFVPEEAVLTPPGRGQSQAPPRKLSFTMPAAIAATMPPGDPEGQAAHAQAAQGQAIGARVTPASGTAAPGRGLRPQTPSIAFFTSALRGSLAPGSVRTPLISEVPAASANIERPLASGTQTSGLQEQRSAIVRLSATVHLIDHFALLEVTAAATVEEIRSKFFGLSRLYHPDRLPAELRDLESESNTIMARLTNAHRVLTDPAQRATYAAELRARRSLPPPPAVREESAIDAARRAMRILPNNHAEALALATAALARPDGDSAEVQTTHAWLVFATPNRTADSDARASLASFDTLIRKHEYHAQAYFWRAQIHKRLGDASAVLSDFRGALLWDDKHAETLLELRLFKKRRATGMTTEQSLGMPAIGAQGPAKPR